MPGEVAPPLLLCSACSLAKPVEEFLEMRSANDPLDADPQVCDHCRRFGPPVEDPLVALTPQWRTAIKALASGGSVTAAARAAGLDHSTVRRALTGKENPVFRAALQRLMLDAGLGPDVVIAILKDATKATKAQYHPRKEDFIEFPDHSNRLKTAQMLMKAWGAEEPRENPDQSPERGMTVIVNTNLGSSESTPVPGTITATAPIDVEPS